MGKQLIIWVTSVLTAVFVATGIAAAVIMDKTVTLTVDGYPEQVSGFMVTVSDVLESRKITIGEHDVVKPDPSTKVKEGDQITVNYGRQLTVTTDGKSAEFWTTGTTLQAAVNELELTFPEDAKLSEPLSTPLGRDGLSLTVTTPKHITIVADGKSTKATTHAATVSDALAEAKIKLGKDDRVTPAKGDAIADKMKITVQRVKIETKTITKKTPFKTKNTKTDKLFKGEKKITKKGKKGEIKEKVRITTVDGKVKSRKVLSTKVISKPVDQEQLVGTKPAPESDGKTLNLARAAMWDRIAQCESSGRWDINTGNGYYGGLQFNLGTWRSVGGNDFASYPHKASRAEQITVANRLYAKRGLQPWGCRHAA